MKRYLWVCVTTAIVSLFIFWLPFWTNQSEIWGIKLNEPSLKTVIANYDGMNFLVVARSWYQPDIIAERYSSMVGERGVRYFAAHYPLYAMVIWFFDLFTSGDVAILLSIILSNLILATSLYYFFVTFLKNKKIATISAIIALFFPARMLTVRSVGSNEPIFIALVLTSLIAYNKNKDWLAAMLGAMATLTRSPGILLFFSYLITIMLRKESWRSKLRSTLPYLMMPAALIGLWGYFGYAYGDPLAYFKVGGNINLVFPPFAVFGTGNDWVSGFWLEDIVFTYAYYLVGIIMLWVNYKKYANIESVLNFGLIYMISTWFIAHRDIARYSLPLLPLATLGYISNISLNKKWLLLLILLLPIYLLGWNFVNNNMAPIADWTPFI